MANLRIAELDFDTIKLNLKNYLKDQNTFSDYDFEGSGLSVLLDVLAYNTHYNAYLANMLVNEMFLDSAVKRSSAVSIAKHLGYIPTSAKGARAVIDITINNPPGTPQFLTLNKYTPFVTTIGSTSYTFLNTQDLTISPVNGNYIFENVTVVEGSQLDYSFSVVTPGPGEKYVIPNENIDTSTLVVTVQNSSSDLTITSYTLATDIVGLDSTSKVFFLEENALGRYQIYFGDGVIGQKLLASNIVKARYLITNADNGNISSTVDQSFSAGATIGGSNSITIDVVSKSTGGAAKEGIDSIKFNAPQYSAARNRAVTSKDYEAIIKANYTGAESVSVWGGEDNDPPIYGKVFISLKPFLGFTITQEVKDGIKASFLNDKKMTAISIEFTDPVYFFVNMTATATFNTNTTSLTANQIGEVIRAKIVDYFSTDLQKFNNDFNKAKLTKLILEANASIVGLLFTLKLQRRFPITLNTPNIYTNSNTIKFKNAIKPGEIESSTFYVSASENAAISSILAKIIDIPNDSPPDNAGSGVLRIVNALTNTLIVNNVGTVNYGTGEIIITGFTPTALPTGINDFRITCNIQETSHNLLVERNEILLLDDSERSTITGREAGLTINTTPAVT